MHSTINIHSDEEIIAHERASYVGGRNECFELGELKDGPFYHYDINSMYPSVMVEEKYPTRLIDVIDGMSIGQLYEYTNRYCAIAEVDIFTDIPVYPKIQGGKVIFPVGRIHCVIPTGSIRFAVEHGHIKKVYKTSFYESDYIFRDYVNYFYELKRKYKEEGNEVYTKLVKIFLNGLYKAELKNAGEITQSGWPIDNIGQDDPVPPFAAWDSTVSYNLTDNSFATGSDGFYYQVIKIPNLNKNPTIEPTYWKKVELLQTWNASINYADDAIVIYQGRLYASNVTPNLNNAPPNASFWDNISFNNSIIGAFTATGTVTAGAFTTAGAVTAATVTASGTATANAVVSTTSVTAASVAASSGVTVGNVAQAGSTILDWYQEGTFTPTIIGSSTAGVGTYLTQFGKYTRIGNCVFFTIHLSWTAHTGTGNIRVGTLPFAAVATYDYTTSIFYSGLLTTAGKQLCTSLAASSSIIDLFVCDPAGAGAAAVPIDTNVTDLVISGNYFA